PSPPLRRPPSVLAVMMGLLLTAGVVLGIRMLLAIGTERTEDARLGSETLPLTARASSRVMQVLVEEDQPVKQGDVLLKLDDRVATIKVAQAEAALAMARAQEQAALAEVQVVRAQALGGLRSARAGLTASQEEGGRVESRIVAAEAELQRARKEAERATRELERVQKLFASEMVSQSHLEDARVAQEVAQATLASAEAGLLAARREMVLHESRVVEAQGRLDQSAASEPRIAMAEANAALASARVAVAVQELEMARLHRSFLTVIAPREGVVAKLTARAGQFVQTGQPLVQLVPSPTVVVANFKETQLRHLQPGQRATLHVDAWPDTPLEGKVLSIAGGTGASFSLLPPNNATGNFVKVVQRVPVRLVLTKPSPVPLQAGLSVEVVVHTR
ncbi:MAG TPA: HlyD family secretion protein, partial [Myxococcaceae bacterium]|nr:HlyD family secretion protein [Myxococcaceae bacterium]